MATFSMKKTDRVRFFRLKSQPVAEEAERVPHAIPSEARLRLSALHERHAAGSRRTCRRCRSRPLWRAGRSTSPSVAPSATRRAASMPCVSGSPPRSPASSPAALRCCTFAPVKIRSNPKMTLLSTAVSRTRSPMPAQISPSPVHENVVTKMTSASAGQVEAGTSMPRIRLPATRARTPRRTSRSRSRAGRGRGRAAGARAARRGCTPSVCWKRSPAIALVIAKRHGIDAYCTALPIT